ncbi:hypothetical protein CVT24_003628 [Panaeolus cyanescens]|uniref:Ankyrin n=1 Tax=Panaeolus cyanescens TaxID=181874 RepID=A0A409Y7X0_9AGAR|nr:hypothetical protein CVT24_003628 [Panaeolus cyanescens]
MAEKDPSARLRRAVKENNLFLVKRLIQRTDMRNPDTDSKRYTSLAWAAVLGNEETFEFLLSAGHDDEELSRDSEHNTILMLLADQTPSTPGAFYSSSNSQDTTGAYLRMARLYYDRYNWILDWSNIHGKTALHIAALKGNEELVRMLCDLGADIDLSDNKGNTPLHYASSWGHVPTVQLLIERGCQYSAKNNQGFTASDYAYSFSTRDTLQDTARIQFENNKKQRRNIFAQAAARANGEYGVSMGPPPVPIKDSPAHRMRSGSGTSRTTATSDSGDPDSLFVGQLSSSPSQPSTGSSSAFFPQSSSSHHTPHAPSTSSVATFSAASVKSQMLNPTANPASALSPIANRVRERDADAMEKYLNRNRSGSQGTASTENKSQNGSQMAGIGALSNDDDLRELMSGTITPRKLRPSLSAAQLRTQASNSSTNGAYPAEMKSRSGTSPTASRGVTSPPPMLGRSSSTSKSLRPMASADQLTYDESGGYTGPPSQYAKFPEPPLMIEDQSTPTASTTQTQHHSRRKALQQILSKPLQSFESSSSSHRRGMSAASVRGS